MLQITSTLIPNVEIFAYPKILISMKPLFPADDHQTHQLPEDPDLGGWFRYWLPLLSFSHNNLSITNDSDVVGSK